MRERPSGPGDVVWQNRLRRPIWIVRFDRQPSSAAAECAIDPGPAGCRGIGMGVELHVPTERPWRSLAGSAAARWIAADQRHRAGRWISQEGLIEAMLRARSIGLTTSPSPATLQAVRRCRWSDAAVDQARPHHAGQACRAPAR
jgi:hypothetical protein